VRSGWVWSPLQRLGRFRWHGPCARPGSSRRLAHPARRRARERVDLSGGRSRWRSSRAGRPVPGPPLSEWRDQHLPCRDEQMRAVRARRLRHHCAAQRKSPETGAVMTSAAIQGFEVEPGIMRALVEVGIGGYQRRQGTARPVERVVQVRRVRLDSPRTRWQRSPPDRCLINGFLRCVLPGELCRDETRPGREWGERHRHSSGAWTRPAAIAWRQGVTHTLSVGLPVATPTVSGLNVYGSTGRPFSEDAERIVSTFAPASPGSCSPT
jgi:hypothetical protein